MAGKITMACSCGQGTYDDADLALDDLIRIKTWWTAHNSHGRRVITIAVDDADNEAELETMEGIDPDTITLAPEPFLMRRPLGGGE